MSLFCGETQHAWRLCDHRAACVDNVILRIVGRRFLGGVDKASQRVAISPNESRLQKSVEQAKHASRATKMRDVEPSVNLRLKRMDGTEIEEEVEQ